MVEEVIEPSAVKACPEAWRRIGEEISERLDCEPARFFRRRIVRPKYVRCADKDAPPVVAPLPPTLQERCLAAPGLIAYVGVSKFADHLPLYRQEAILRSRHGIELGRHTMSGWLAMGADWLVPIYEEIRVTAICSAYVQFDETPVRYLEPGAGKAPLGYLWTALVPKTAVLYAWFPSREHGCLNEVLGENYGGTLGVDGFSAYRTYAGKRGGEVRLAGCWAHVRRRFHDAKEHSRTALWFLHQIKLLYEVERELREARAGPRLRQAVRSWKSRPIVLRIRKALELIKRSAKHLPKSTMGKAIDYALEQWDALGVFLEDGRVEIDNNLVEWERSGHSQPQAARRASAARQNAIRPTAVGKKNWLFMGSEASGQTAAIWLTLIENCRLHGLDPFHYLREVLTRLPTETNHSVRELTPAAYAARQRESMRRAS